MFFSCFPLDHIKINLIQCYLMIQNNKTDIKSKKTVYKYNSYLYFFFRIVIRLTFFLFLMQLSLLLFYFVGNYQNFSDDNQNIILTVLSVISIIEFIFSVSSISVNIATFLISQRTVRKLIAYMVFHLFTIAVSVFSFVFSRGILFFSAGLL